MIKQKITGVAASKQVKRVTIPAPVMSISPADASKPLAKQLP